MSDRHIITVQLVQTTAGTAETIPIALPATQREFKWTATLDGFAADTAVTADNTNYATLKLSDGTTDGATFSTTVAGTGDIAQYGRAVASDPDKSLTVAHDGTLRVVVTKPGTGARLTGAVTISLSARVRS